jgi:hypothetical protein
MASLSTRVAVAAAEALALRQCVTALDVLTGIGWLTPAQVDRWRQGRVSTLAELAQVNTVKLVAAVEQLRRWAQAQGLTPSPAQYLSAGRDHAELRFCPGDDAAFRVHWLAPDLGPARRQQLVERQNTAPDLVVVEPSTAFDCAECGDTGPYLIAAEGGPLCLTCADLDHLVFLPAGNAALSRRAKKESTLAAVVVHFNARRKRYERRGVLVEESALARAEEQCLADADLRAARRERDRLRRADADLTYQAAMAAEIRRLFPRCPAERATAIAEHAGQRGSGRVGRTAAAKALDEQAVTMAVVASVRHLDTRYDELLMNGMARGAARERIRDDIERVLTRWRG